MISSPWGVSRLALGIRPVAAEEAISAHPLQRSTRKQNGKHRGRYRGENQLEEEQKRRSGRRN
jgi:hypothetical protein